MSSLLAQVTLGMLGGGGAGATYIAGGAIIDIATPARGIDIAVTEQIDRAEVGIDIDLERAGAELEVTNDGNGIDLQR